jgi:hypothetical protein
MKRNELNHTWMSAKKYAEETGLGAEKVKQFIRDGKLEGLQTEDGYWKVKVYKNDAVSREVFEREHKKRIEAETTIKLMKNLLQVGE